jgi:hypothetical protein
MSTIVHNPKHAVFGIGMILTGLPMYFLFRTNRTHQS